MNTGAVPSLSEAGREVITFTRFDQVKPRALDPVIDGYLYADTLNLMIGKSGSCKSFMAVGMSAAVATGAPFAARRADPGAVFYLAGEGQAGLHKRFKAWSEYTGLSLAERPLYLSAGMPALTTAGGIAGTLEAIKRIAEELFFQAGALEPRLVVIDTLARAMVGADENSAMDAGRLIDSADWIRSQFKCCVGLVHHVGLGEGAGSRGRGSSAFYAASDGELLVSSDANGLVTLKSQKEKDWPKPPDLLFERHVRMVDLGGTEESTLVLDLATRPPRAAEHDEMRERVRILRAGGMPIRQVADQLGISKSAADRHEQALKQEQAYREVSDVA